MLHNKFKTKLFLLSCFGFFAFPSVYSMDYEYLGIMKQQESLRSRKNHLRDMLSNDSPNHRRHQQSLRIVTDPMGISDLFKKKGNSKNRYYEVSDYDAEIETELNSSNPSEAKKIAIKPEDFMPGELDDAGESSNEEKPRNAGGKYGELILDDKEAPQLSPKSADHQDPPGSGPEKASVEGDVDFPNKSAKNDSRDPKLKPRYLSLTTPPQTKDDELKSLDFYIEHPMYEPGFKFDDKQKETFKLWPNAHIPYYIDAFSFDKGMRDKIRNHLYNASLVTAVKFVPLVSPPEDKSQRWILFLNRRQILECEEYTSYDFSNTGVQDVVLGYDCVQDGGKMGGLVLAIAGVAPMHNAPNRDSYIQVHEEEIIPENKPLFQKLDKKQWLFQELPYDFNSAGHFHMFKYNKRGKPTITAKNNTGLTIGLAKGLSKIDTLKIAMMYNQNLKSRKVTLSPDQCNKMFDSSHAKKSKIKQMALKIIRRPFPEDFLSERI